jgi:selenocysteine lyase/cysteine desulfurase
MGERDFFISMEMASIGMEMLARWGWQAVGSRLAMLTAYLAESFRAAGVSIPDDRVRAPHMLSVSLPDGEAKRLVERLATENIYVALRLGRVRISPHVYNDENDLDRFIEVFHRVTRPV